MSLLFHRRQRALPSDPTNESVTGEPHLEHYGNNLLMI